MGQFNPKFSCPKCGLPNDELNKISENRRVRCPRCGALLMGIGRVWWVVG